jgi:hypothetical protein
MGAESVSSVHATVTIDVPIGKDRRGSMSGSKNESLDVVHDILIKPATPGPLFTEKGNILMIPPVAVYVLENPRESRPPVSFRTADIKHVLRLSLVTSWPSASISSIWTSGWSTAIEPTTTSAEEREPKGWR